MAEMRLVQAGDVRLAYRESGPDPAAPVVLLHALGEDSSDWDGVAAALSQTCHVYAVDLRGHGRSGWPAGTPCRSCAMTSPGSLTRSGWVRSP
jgi:3-oxoadipate enol-lactonase